MKCSANREQKNLLLYRGAAYSLLDKVKRNTMKKLTKENAAELFKTAVEHKKEWEEKIKARYSHQTTCVEFI